MSKKKTRKATGFVMDGTEPNYTRTSKLPPLAIPTDDFAVEGHHVYRHLPKIREGKLEPIHGDKTLRKLRQEVENG